MFAGTAGAEGDDAPYLPTRVRSAPATTVPRAPEFRDARASPSAGTAGEGGDPAPGLDDLRSAPVLGEGGRRSSPDRLPPGTAPLADDAALIAAQGIRFSRGSGGGHSTINPTEGSRAAVNLASAFEEERAATSLVRAAERGAARGRDGLRGDPSPLDRAGRGAPDDETLATVLSVDPEGDAYVPGRSASSC